MRMSAVGDQSRAPSDATTAAPVVATAMAAHASAIGR